MTREHRADAARPLAIRWLMFNSVGVLGFGVQLVTLIALTELVGLHYLASTGIAVEMAILHNFAWHQRWTWRDRFPSGPRGHWHRWVRFNLVNGVIALADQLVCTSLYTEMLGVHYSCAVDMSWFPKLRPLIPPAPRSRFRAEQFTTGVAASSSPACHSTTYSAA